MDVIYTVKIFDYLVEYADCVSKRAFHVNKVIRFYSAANSTTYPLSLIHTGIKKQVLNHYSFRVTGLYPKTGRMRTRIIDAFDDSDLRESIKKHGLVPPLTIEEIDHERPTSMQIEYASDLGITIENSFSKQDVSALIDRKLNYDKAAPEDLRDYAKSKRIYFSNQIGSKGLYSLIYNSLSGVDKAAFFVFMIYRHLTDDRVRNLDVHPHKLFFYHIGEKIFLEDSLFKSISSYDGEDLRFFGEIEIQGTIESGGSINTKGYAFAAKAVSRQFGTPKTRSLKFNITSPDKNLGSSEEDFHTSDMRYVIIGTLFIFLIILIFLVMY
jgi:hypothetical protein